MHSIQTVPVARLTVSSTGAQAERRRRFDKSAITELADSIRSVGILQPLVVRASADTEGPLQIVAGERRFLAAREAGLAEVPCNVLELNDEQVLEVQLVENLQREGLHELVEAEGYEALMKLGHTVEDLVAKLGKSRGYIYARLKLLALGKEARKAFFDGTLSASIALLIARIPGDELQRQALKEVTAGRWNGGPMSYREALAHVQDQYMLKLGGAGFPTGDAHLVPSAGACGACPKRTGNQPELFGDVKGADVCTDPACFQAKRKAWATQRLEEARAEGRPVIDGAQAKKIATHGGSVLSGDWVKLDDHCYDDDKGRTYRQLLGKDAQPTLIEVQARSGGGTEVIEAIRKADAAETLKKKGVGVSAGKERDRYQAEQKARERKAARETEIRRRVFEAVRKVSPAALKRAELERVAISLADGIGHDSLKRLFSAWSWEPKKSGMHKGIEMDAAARIAKLSDADLSKFMLDCTLIDELYVGSYALDAKPEKLLAAAKRARVDVEKIRAAVLAEEKAKQVAKPKKKAA